MIDDFDAQLQLAQQRRQRFAQQLQGAQDAPQGRMVGNVYVAPNFLQYAAQALRGVGAMRGEDLAGQEIQQLGQQRQQALGQALRTFGEKAMGTPAETLPEGVEGPTRPGVAPDMRGAYSALMQAPDAGLRQAGMQGLAQIPQMEARQQERLDERAWREQQAQAAREERAANLKLAHEQRMEQLRQSNADRAALEAERRAFQEQMARESRELRLQLSGAGQAPKPLPASALKMQQEALDAIGVVGGINADLKALEQQIDKGELSFGPISNLFNTGRNLSGLSSQESRNFATFKSNMERLRNESLRLNAGVQTDGDAQRAWNELFQNITDTKLVKQRLQEIQRINQRGAELQKLKIDQVRTNYGYEPLDVSPQMTQTPALRGGSNLSPQDQQALDWANSNPNDPRAAQIKQRLGR